MKQADDPYTRRCNWKDPVDVKRYREEWLQVCRAQVPGAMAWGCRKRRTEWGIKKRRESPERAEAERKRHRKYNANHREAIQADQRKYYAKHREAEAERKRKDRAKIGAKNAAARQLQAFAAVGALRELEEKF